MLEIKPVLAESCTVQRFCEEGTLGLGLTRRLFCYPLVSLNKGTPPNSLSCHICGVDRFGSQALTHDHLWLPLLPQGQSERIWGCFILSHNLRYQSL